MARINIEDQFWLDIAEVIEKHPNQDKVIGNAIRFFRFAQEEHKKGKLISEDDYKAKGFLEELIPTFAKRTPSGIQANGAQKHFDWLVQKSEAGKKGGKKSAKRGRDANGRLLKKQAKQPKKHQAKPNDHQASSSYSSSYSDSNSASLVEIPTESKPKAFIAGYCERFKSLYGFNPEIQGKDAGVAKRVSESLSHEKISRYLDAFFSMPDAWLVKTKHQLSAFETKLNEVVVFANSGAFTTMADVRDADKNVRGIQEQVAVLNDPDFKNRFDDQKKIAGGVE